MRVRSCFVITALAIAVCLPTVGCDSGPHEAPLTTVSGTVTLDGSPMADGEITFVEPAKGAVDTIKVTNGTFEGKAQPGEKRVEIRAYRPGKPNTAMYGPDAKAEMENYIPSKFNTDSKLKTTIAPEGAKDLKFDAASK